MKALRMETKEHFIVLHLDAKNKILCQDVVSIGTGNSSLVSAKEVMKTALLSSAEALILVHNHPSGDTKPSQEDIQVTKKISKAAELFSIRVLDHIVIGDNYYSFAENGDL
jgi:DNA repair protein RadC